VAAGRELLLRLAEAPETPVRRASLRLLESMGGLPPGPAAASALRRAAALAENHDAQAEARADAVALLALAARGRYAPLFRKLIDPHEPEPVGQAAVRAFGRVQGEEVGAFLIKSWREMTPAVRAEAADAMYLEPGRVRLLLDALKKGDVQPWTLAFRHKRRLIMSEDPAIRAEARPLLEQAPREREAVVERYRAALDRKGDPARGREVFRSVCSKCHRLNGEGAEVGPDLATVRHQPKASLLRDILIPSQSISQGFEAYVVETAGGAMLDGVLGPQTATTLALRHEDGKQDLIQRKDIKSMYVTNLSAMPADLEKQVDVQQMADLLEYMKTAQEGGR
jgi:putative heme-binding domain-containing protein